MAARLHSENMATRNYFAHDTPEGMSPTARAAAEGYTEAVGENIAYGYATARLVMLGWMASAGHCRNILGLARDIGVGSANPSRPYVTQDFGDYAFGSANAAAAGCPYEVDFDALVLPGAAATPVAADPRTTATAPGTTAPPSPAVAPALGRLGLSTARLRPGRGAAVSYVLSAPARVTFRVQRLARGRWRTLTGSVADAGEQGANSFRFRPRLAGRALATGRYRLRAIARDAARRASPARTVRFRVVGG